VKTGLQIYLLGSFRLLVDGFVISNEYWQKRKAKLLVQILALKQSHEIHREELIEMLFPDVDLKMGNANLYRVLYAARFALEPDRNSYASSNYLLTEGQQIKLSSTKRLWIDTEEFELKARNGLKTNNQELLESAVELYKGDLLEDEPFEQWLINKREKFRTIFHTVLRRLAEDAEKRNDTEESHLWYDRILQHDPVDETAHRAKMRLYVEFGNNSLALKQYEKCCELLRRELSVEPDEETRRLKQQILDAKRK
jgi:DNA-binding SARP family transcriptional activator